MRVNHIVADPWKIIEDSFHADHVEAAESIFSLGNGAMWHRANFEEQYTGQSFQGSYIAGVYYPDKTKVGWWKNGYPKDNPNMLGALGEISSKFLTVKRSIQTCCFGLWCLSCTK